jgi:phosphoribosylaminoimidazolecarboxamide formyltransferase/IMP cyclohydrolase
MKQPKLNEDVKKLVKVKRALVSVSNKDKIIDFCWGLSELGIEIISTGGTAKTLREADIPVKGVSDITKFPEMLDGRVKTLHPFIHGAILADRTKETHLSQLKEQGIEEIDMVVVNLYPFAQTIAKENVALKEAIENIDIGGPTMIRSAAKNFEGVAVVVNPERYQEILDELKRNNGSLSVETNFSLAKEAFQHTAEYDTVIYRYLYGEESDFPNRLNLSFEKIQDLRYGENPHQKAAYYREADTPEHALVFAQQLHGKALSFNNILDLDAALGLVREFTVPAAIIIKHTNPCGVALADDLLTAYKRAHACDPLSAFGSVIGLNRVVDAELAKEISSTFVEAVIAPAYLEEALEILTKKKDIRLLYIGEGRSVDNSEKDIKRIDGGILVQDKDKGVDDRSAMKVVTKRIPTDEEWGDLLFGWRIAKHVKSNAIVLVSDLQAVGVGAGQMSRVVSTEIAAKKAGERAKGSVMASDAFFPFRDGIDAAAAVGAKAIIQPGGSIKDEEVIAAANEHNIAMVFTGKRHFKH